MHHDILWGGPMGESEGDESPDVLARFDPEDTDSVRRAEGKLKATFGLSVAPPLCGGSPGKLRALLERLRRWLKHTPDNEDRG